MANKFLIVDDSSTTRAVIKRTINMAQIPTENIYEAGNGAEALTLMEQFKVDLVLADLNMPVMGGVEMTQKMRKNPALKDIPVIVVSSESMEKKIALLRAQGVKGYIKKPFTPEQIRDVVLEVIGGAVHA